MSGWNCTECRWHGDTPQRITLYTQDGSSEFALVVCPECRQISSSLEECCDEPGCSKTAGCGWPTKDGGYRRTCHLHMPTVVS